MKSVMLAAESLSLGRNEIMVAGGFESMSNAPYYMSRGETPYGGVQVKTNIMNGFVSN